MNIFLDTNYSSPIDIGLNHITKNWTCFLKIRLKHPLKDELTLLIGEHAFMVEFEGGEHVINNVELVTKAQKL
jgi:hypothetical protein